MWRSFEQGVSYSLKRSPRGFYYVRRVYESPSRSSTEVKRLQSEVEILKNHKSQSEQKAASLKNEIEALTQSSKNMKTENESLQNELKNLFQTTNSLRKENESLKNEMTKMTQTTNSLKNENEELKNKIRDTESIRILKWGSGEFHCHRDDMLISHNSSRILSCNCFTWTFQKDRYVCLDKGH